MRSEVPEELRQDYDVLASAWPDGLPDADYLPLLVALDDDFSHRQLVALVAAFTGRDQIDVECDRTTAISDPRQVAGVLNRLREAGYEPDA